MVEKKQIVKKSSDIRMLFRKDKVIIANIYSGNWMRVTKDIYDLLVQAETDDLSIEAILESYRDEDQEYLLSLFDKLQELGYLGNGKRNTVKLEDVKIKITHRCNLSCKHCIISAGTITDKEIFSTEEMKELLDKVIDCNPGTITLTGGEPMVRDDFFELLEYISQHSNCKIGLMTNGTIITKDNAKFLNEKITYFDISVDGINEDSCSIVRGKNVFSKVMNAIKLLKHEGADNIALSMVATSNNARYEVEFKQLCKELGVVPVIRNFEEGGRGIENLEMLKTTFSEKKPLYHDVQPDLKQIQKGLKVCCCRAGLDALSIEENGDIKICTLLSKNAIVGNLKEISDLKYHLQQQNLFDLPAYKYFNSLWPDSCEFCKSCDVNLFCWTCPHELELHLMNKKDFRATCAGKRKFLSEIVWGN